MNNKNLNKFICKTLIVLFPFLLILFLYIILDPFMVIRDYPTFYQKGVLASHISKDYVSTTTYKKQYQQYRYDSFIFGNSRSMVYEISDWQKHLLSHSSCYHFDAFNESLYGIYKKILYIDKKGEALNNILLILDRETLYQDKTDESDHLYIISPQLENNKNIVKFHTAFIKAFCAPKFLYAFLDYKISGKLKDYMVNDFLDVYPFDYNQITNEIRFLDTEEKIEKGTYYTNKRLSKFYRLQGDFEYYSVIKDSQKKMLEEIKQIFTKHHTNYRIVINPMYNQIKLNHKDLHYLEDLFGKDFVFDFSGKNILTENYHNFYDSSYDNSHYRPQVSRQIMEIIYETDSTKRAGMLKSLGIK